MSIAVHLVDVNNLLHIGNHRFSKYSIMDTTGGFKTELNEDGSEKTVVQEGRKFLTGGMYQVMNLLRGRTVDPVRDLFFFCFDRRSVRKDINPDYKAGRPKMPAYLAAQGNELYKWLPKMGYNALAVDGYEADDIIATIYNQIKDEEDIRYIRIYSTDRDGAYMVSDKTDLISSNSRVPSVDKQNYEAVVGKSKGHRVRYNTVLVYKCICGDERDNIPSICRESYALYNRLMNKLEELNIPLSEIGKDLSLTVPVLEMLPPDMAELAKANWQMVQPRFIDDLQLKQQSLSSEGIREFCEMFDMKSIAKTFGINLDTYKHPTGQYRVSLIDSVLRVEQSNTHGDIQDDVDDEEPEISDSTDAIERATEMLKMRDAIEDSTASLAADIEEDQKKVLRESQPAESLHEQNPSSSIDTDHNSVDGE